MEKQLTHLLYEGSKEYLPGQWLNFNELLLFIFRISTSSHCIMLKVLDIFAYWSSSFGLDKGQLSY